MRTLIASVLALLWVVSAPLQAQNAPVVVELYTSQGCSSCPPADALLAKLARREGVIALALHVDYWDYIGWKDKFADPKYTARQKAYARNEGRRMIYTPQMIVGGKGHVVGHKPMEVIDQIEAARAQSSGVELSVARSGAKLRISARGSGQKARDLSVQLVRYVPEQTVKITRGENAGRTIDYFNIVTDLRELTTWDGKGTLELSANAPGNDPLVVIVQEKGPGRILAAQELR